MVIEKYKNKLSKHSFVVSAIIITLLLVLNPSEILGSNYFPTLIFSLALFVLLMHINYSCKTINYLSKYNFEIYLIHHRVFILLLPLFWKITTNNAQKCIVFIGLLTLVFLMAEKIQLLSGKLINKLQ